MLTEKQHIVPEWENGGVGGAPRSLGSSSWPILSRRRTVTRRDSSESRLESLASLRRKVETSISTTFWRQSGHLHSTCPRDPLISAKQRVGWVCAGAKLRADSKAERGQSSSGRNNEYHATRPLVCGPRYPPIMSCRKSVSILYITRTVIQPT